ncbi:MAG: hypothetical protein ACI9J3_002949 [Parvicellaceae bacterium]|jgi:hypothetical protein
MMKIAFGLLILAFSLTSLNGTSQTLKEKLALKLEEQRKKSQDKNNPKVESASTESIKAIAKRWDEQCERTNYKPPSIDGKLERRGVTQINFIKDSVGNIIAIHLGGDRLENGDIKKPKIYIPYDYEASDFTEAYFKDAMHIIYLTDKSVVEYSVDSKYQVKWINKVIGEKGKSVKAWRKEIQAYRDYRDVRIAEDREARKQAEIANRAKYSLESKTVTDIKVVFIGEKPKVAKVGTSLKFGLEVTLADGSKDKTHNIGGNLYLEDFKSNYSHLSGIGSKYYVGKWGGHCHCYDATASFEGDAKPSEKDLTNITIESKFGGTGKGQLSLPIVYEKTTTFGRGGMVKVYVKKIKHSETGETLFQCKVDDRFVRIREGGALVIEAAGSMGPPGRTGCCDKYPKDDKIRPGPGGNGGNGSDGGAIIVVKDPNVKGSSFQFRANVDAGLAGPAGAGGKCWNCLYNQNGESGRPGLPGEPGSISEKTGKVPF